MALQIPLQAAWLQALQSTVTNVRPAAEMACTVTHKSCRGSHSAAGREAAQALQITKACSRDGLPAQKKQKSTLQTMAQQIPLQAAWLQALQSTVT